MLMPRSRTVLLIIATALWMTAACDSDESVTSPPVDSVPPEISISAAPTAGQATEPVTLEWAASDDVGLGTVSVSWGVPGSQQSFRATGRSLEGSSTYAYDRLGEFTVFVKATDEAGNTATATHSITIGSPAPSAPARVTVVVDGNTATIDWQPGAWSTSQEIVVSRTDGIEPERIGTLDRSFHEFDVADLHWEAMYEARVVAVNELGRAESAPVSFEVAQPVPPWLFRFSSAVEDSTCLEVVWNQGPHAAVTYDVVVTGATEAESFTEALPADADTGLPYLFQQARFCSTDYPIVDGMTYTAQVFARFDESSYGSNLRGWTADFDPTYSIIGTWSGERRIWWPFDTQERLIGHSTLELEEADGTITGTWTSFDAEGAISQSGTVTGTRVGKSVEFVLEVSGAGYGNWVEGSFAGAEGIVGTLWFAGLGFSAPVFFQRD